ncbi:MAG: NAD(P)H-hydrate dehydratase [Armatimonadetes bacterium]|nr:NAD(P)H-hydrate dehydratase [Armatimonadota bacterium]
MRKVWVKLDGQHCPCAARDGVNAMWIGTSEHCRSVDRRSSEDFGLPASVLMERAGFAVFEAVTKMLPSGGKIAVLCGRGNNGGDGFVVARLAVQAGYQVECLVAATEKDLREDALNQYKVARATGVHPIFADNPRWTRKIDCLGGHDLLVDALLGIGAVSQVHGTVREAIQAINRSGVPVVAVDVPSGIDCNTGEELGESVWALRTVTFGFPKPFLFEGIGLEHSGYWTVADIGYPAALLNEVTESRLIDEDWVASLLPERLKSAHKGDSGHVLIVAGSRWMRGAVTLAAKGALRAGAGLVTVASIPSVLDAVAAQLPEVLLLPLPEDNGVISPMAVHDLLEYQERVDSALFGPGLTHDKPVLDLLKATWREWRRPCVIDADALNSVSHGVTLPPVECILTPHPGEMSRLLNSSIAEIQADRFRAVDSAVSEYGQCVLLKGPHTIVGEPGQPMMVNCTGNPGMASGGFGDVLSGMAATLLAQQLPSYYAASCAVYWHGLAGDICACKVGGVGYLASDLVEAIPSARSQILGNCDTDS